jgi:hypothetical protein
MLTLSFYTSHHSWVTKSLQTDPGHMDYILNSNVAAEISVEMPSSF